MPMQPLNLALAHVAVMMAWLCARVYQGLGFGQLGRPEVATPMLNAIGQRQ